MVEAPVTDQIIVDRLGEIEILALTLWGEARNQPIQGLIAVGCVIRNRMRDGRWPSGAKAACLQPKQFSCWNAGPDVNHSRVMAQAERLVEQLPVLDPRLRECLFLAEGILSDQLRDPTNGATHYYAPLGMEPPGRVPTWADGKPTQTIGDHEFLRA